MTLSVARTLLLSKSMDPQMVPTAYSFGNVVIVRQSFNRSTSTHFQACRKSSRTVYHSCPTRCFFALNFASIVGKYNGSSTSILEGSHVFDDVREMPIVGDSGLFRSAHGYALAHKIKFDSKTGDAIAEYNVYVSHY